MPESWISDKKIDIIVRLLEARSDDVPEDVPWVGDFLKDPHDLAVLRLLTTSMEIGRPFVASGQVPRERIELLQNAFEAALKDKEFLELARQQAMDINLVTGKAAQELLTEVFAAPESVSERAREIIKWAALRSNSAPMWKNFHCQLLKRPLWREATARHPS
jgi:hypothetical protein